MFETDEMEDMSWEQFEEESGFNCWEDVMADYCGE
jgi:hypothetical protein